MKTLFSKGLSLITLTGWLLLAPGWAEASTTTRVSVDSAGGQANDFSGAPVSISTDGRFVTFTSWATNLVAGDTNGAPDIFVRDRQSGTTTRVSVDSAGGQANSDSSSSFISADGRFVAFVSNASNLVAGDTNGTWDIFVHDRQTGTTTRVSVDSAGGQTSGSGIPYYLSISADGRSVAFVSDASNLVAGDTNGTPDVFVHDRQTGTTTRVSVDSFGNQANGFSIDPSISADGRFVVFRSGADNLVAGDTNGTEDIFVHDRQTDTTTRVSVDSAGNQANSYSYSFDPSISADGRFVAFYSSALNLVAGDTNGAYDVFVHDRQTGATTRVSVDSAGGQANGFSFGSSISADGRFVAFGSQASNLVAGDTNSTSDSFVHDRQTGATTQVSVDSAGVQANGFSYSASISADGRSVAFVSDASNLVAGDTNDATDVFVHQCGAELSALITSKSGPQNARVWTLTLANKSYCPADTAQIDGLTLTQTYGAACTPVITSPAAFPLSVGTILGNSTASGTLTLDFSGCANTARFRVTIPFGADNGAVSGSKTLNNQFR